MAKTQGFWSPSILLKGPMDLFRLTPSELQYWDCSMIGTKDTWGGTKVYGIRAKAREAIFSQTEVLTDAIVSFLSLSLTEPEERHNVCLC